VRRDRRRRRRRRARVWREQGYGVHARLKKGVRKPDQARLRRVAP
jgi:hypothetical protein